MINLSGSDLQLLFGFVLGLNQSFLLFLIQSVLASQRPRGPGRASSLHLHRIPAVDPLNVVTIHSLEFAVLQLQAVTKRISSLAISALLLIVLQNSCKLPLLLQGLQADLVLESHAVKDLRHLIEVLNDADERERGKDQVDDRDPDHVIPWVIVASRAN